MTRRRRAVVEFLTSVLGLALQTLVRRYLGRRDDYDGPPSVSGAGVAVGALQQLGFLWAYDRDVARIRTDKWRLLAYGLCSGLAQRWLLEDEAFRHGFHTGRPLATILYRFWYGVVRPVPGGEE